MNALLILVILGIIGALILGAVITATRGWRWIRFLITSITVFAVGGIAWYGNYRLSATEAFHENSPDGRFQIVVYRLPNYSMTPGGYSDAPAVIKLFDSSGHLLEQSDLPMLQLAEVEWSENSVVIGNIHWKLDRERMEKWWEEIFMRWVAR
jgi:MFS family permease